MSYLDYSSLNEVAGLDKALFKLCAATVENVITIKTRGGKMKIGKFNDA